MYYVNYRVYIFVDCGEQGAVGGASVEAFVPKPRMNCVMAHKQNTVYLYGGLYEPGDKQVLSYNILKP